MQFEWNEEKSRRNKRKHKITFEAARAIFFDPAALTTRNRVVDGEERWKTVGRARDAVLSVIHTVEEEGQDEIVRIISARKATPSERRLYEADQENR
jgi:uncharacterized DUF497 family protein